MRSSAEWEVVAVREHKLDNEYRPRALCVLQSDKRTLLKVGDRLLLPKVDRRACPLTSRQMEVLEELAIGHRIHEIAKSMGLDASTVRSHLSRIYSKLGVNDRANAVLLATENDWL